jgi:putative NADH-flavin reductase
MNIAIIGASAGIGNKAVTQALEKGYQVTTLSRSVEGLPNHPWLTKITGSADSVNDLKKILPGTDAVLVTIGTKKKKGTTLFSDTAKAILEACKELNYSGKIIIVTGFGTGESHGFLSLFMRLIIDLLLKDQYADKTLMEQLITSSSVKWEIVKPGILSNGPLTKSYKILPDLHKGLKVGKISRDDVAHYLLSEVEDPKHLFQNIAITS